MSYFGIDIGGTAVKYGIVTEEGRITCKGEYPVAFDQYQTPILTTVLETSEKFLTEHHTDMKELKGIGISATGQIDSKQGLVAGVGGNIINWTGARLKDEMESKYHLPVTVVNDANCVALGEKWVGNAKDYRNAIVITVGTGIGGGIIVDNQILLGHMGFAGEIGHFSIDRNGRECTCGNSGCYEQYASMTALIKSVKQVLPITDYPDIVEEQVDGKLIFQLVKNEEPVICKIVEQWILDIATGLISLTHIFNPEAIIIGGGVCAQQELFIDKVAELVKSKVMTNFGKDLIIQKAGLGNSAGLVGAVYYLKKRGEL